MFYTILLNNGIRKTLDSEKITTISFNEEEEEIACVVTTDCEMLCIDLTKTDNKEFSEFLGKIENSVDSPSAHFCKMVDIYLREYLINVLSIKKASFDFQEKAATITMDSFEEFYLLIDEEGNGQIYTIMEQMLKGGLTHEPREN